MTRAREESGLETAASARERARAGGAPRSAPTPEALPAARAPSTHPVTPAGVLALQRSAGNRAVARRLGPAADRGERRLARQRRTVRQAMHEAGVAGQPDVAWTASYDVEFTDDESSSRSSRAINRDADVTEADERTVRRQTRGAFARIWDNRFELEDLDSAEVFPVRVKLDNSCASDRTSRSSLHSGNGNDDLQNWFVGSSGSTARTSSATSSACSTSTSTRTSPTAPRPPRRAFGPTIRSWATTRPRASRAHAPSCVTAAVWRGTSARPPADGCARGCAAPRRHRPAADPAVVGAAIAIAAPLWESRSAYPHRGGRRGEPGHDRARPYRCFTQGEGERARRRVDSCRPRRGPAQAAERGRQRGDGPPPVQPPVLARFGEPEHKAIGDKALPGSLAAARPAPRHPFKDLQLTFGDWIALGDWFEDIGEIKDMLRADPKGATPSASSTTRCSRRSARRPQRGRGREKPGSSTWAALLPSRTRRVNMRYADAEDAEHQALPEPAGRRHRTLSTAEKAERTK